jgi:cytochrome c-type biogenesis protein CcmF
VLVAVLLAALSVAQADMEAAAGAPPPDRVSKALAVNLNSMAQIDNTQSKHAREIGRELVCLCGTCPKEPITDCRCGWAGMNKQTIQHLVAKGMTRDQILEAYHKEYGDPVMAMIPKTGFAQAAWIVPYAAGGIGLLTVFIIGFRSLRKRSSAGPDLPPSVEAGQDVRKELAKELDELD